MSKPVHITDSTFDAEVLKSDIPVLTDFWAEWCGPCKVIAPILDQIAVEYDGRIKITKMDVDQNNQTAMQLGVQSIPTLILFKNGQAVERLVGSMPKDRLLSRILPHLPSASE
ncbi:MAG: thioredoxin [Anaerolineales bacterium]|nr:MAG: thioredoxin [Anaerolineales bacterium]